MASIAGLGAGDFQDISIDLNQNLQGTDTLYGVVDRANMIVDCHVGNNTMSSPALSLKPDLVALTIDLSASDNDAFTFDLTGQVTVEVSNRGTLAVTEPYDLVAYYDENVNGVYDSDTDRLLGQQNANTLLGVGQSNMIPIHVTGVLPFRDAPISVFVDAQNQVTELDEANNYLSSAGSCEDNSQASIDLALCLDGSGSINSTEFRLQTEGTAQAIENPLVFPQDGSVRLSLYQFNAGTRVEIAPTIITQDNVGAIAGQIRGIGQLRGGTNIHSCIDTAVNTITPLIPESTLQVIDVSTDGRSSQSAAEAASLRARNAGIDSLNSLGVGDGIDQNLLESIVFPQPVGGDAGFVLLVGSFEQYAEAIATKIQRETSLADLTIGGLIINDTGGGQPIEIRVRVGNAGSTASEETQVRFYSGDPTDPVNLLEAVTVSPIEPGQFVDITVTTDGPFALDTHISWRLIKMNSLQSAIWVTTRFH